MWHMQRELLPDKKHKQIENMSWLVRCNIPFVGYFFYFNCTWTVVKKILGRHQMENRKKIDVISQSLATKFYFIFALTLTRNLRRSSPRPANAFVMESSWVTPCGGNAFDETSNSICESNGRSSPSTKYIGWYRCRAKWQRYTSQRGFTLRANMGICPGGYGLGWY